MNTIPRFDNCFAEFDEETLVSDALDKLLRRIIVAVPQGGDKKIYQLWPGSILLEKSQEEPLLKLKDLSQGTPSEPFIPGVDSNGLPVPVHLLYTGKGFTVVLEMEEEIPPPLLPICPPPPDPEPYIEVNCPECHVLVHAAQEHYHTCCNGHKFWVP